MGRKRTERAGGGSSRGELETTLAGAVADGRLAAAVAVLATGEGRPRTVFSSGPDPARALFDLASLTKPFTATLALRLSWTRELPLDTEIGALAEGVHESLARARLEDLLRHRAGLLAWAPLYRWSRSRTGVERLLLGGRLLDRSRRAGGVLYSDLGYILWGLLAEDALGETLDSLLRRRVLDPLGFLHAAFAPGARPEVVACPCDNRREVELGTSLGTAIAARPAPARGEVQDGNARFLGGVAGHAGLFATPLEVVRLGRLWLRARAGRAGPLDPATVRRALGGRGAYALGWARRRVRGSAGPSLSAAAFGHVGFTGGSLWVDPCDEGRVIALVAQRTTPEVDLQGLRRRFHRLAVGI